MELYNYKREYITKFRGQFNIKAISSEVGGDKSNRDMVWL
jgi:hypothetical protein